MAMKKLVAGLFASGLAVAGVADSASARPAGAGGGGQPAGIACQQAGISTLRALDLLPAVAKSGIEVVGVGIVAFPDVLALHRSSPELFQTGGVTVVVPGVGEVPATWCDEIG